MDFRGVNPIGLIYGKSVLWIIGESLSVTERLSFFLFPDLVSCKVAVGIHGGFAAGGGGNDGLAVVRVGTIAGSKHTRDIRAGTVAIRDDVAFSITVQVSGKQIRVRTMPDGKEESVNINMAELLVGRAFPIYKVCAVHLVLAREAQGVALEEHFDFRILKDPFLHDVGGAQVGLADNHIDLFAQAREVGRFLARRVAAAYDSDRLFAVEEPVARSTRRDPAPLVVLFGLYAEELGTCARGDDDRVGGPPFVVVNLHTLGRGAEIHFGDHARTYVRAETLGLAAYVVHHLEGFDAVGVAREILYFGGNHELSARLHALEEDRVEVSARGVDGSGVARRSGADDETLCVRLPRPPQRGGLQSRVRSWGVHVIFYLVVVLLSGVIVGCLLPQVVEKGVGLFDSKRLRVSDICGISEAKRGGLARSLADFDRQGEQGGGFDLEYETRDARRGVAGGEGDERLPLAGKDFFVHLTDRDECLGVEERVGLQQLLFGGRGERKFFRIFAVHVERLPVVSRFDSPHRQQELPAVHGECARVGHGLRLVVGDGKSEVRAECLVL